MCGRAGSTVTVIEATVRSRVASQVLQPFVTRVATADPASGSGMSTVLVCAPDLTRTRIAYAVSETGSETLSHATCPVRSNDCGPRAHRHVREDAGGGQAGAGQAQGRHLALVARGGP